MPHPNQPMNGDNGKYSICLDCAKIFRPNDQNPPRGIGMWEGTCDYCGETAYLANALHDFDIQDSIIEHYLAFQPLVNDTCNTCGSVLDTDGSVMEGSGCPDCLGIDV